MVTDHQGTGTLQEGTEKSPGSLPVHQGSILGVQKRLPNLQTE